MNNLLKLPFWILSVLIVLLMEVSGCTTSSENRFEYPEDFTAEYCYNNYSPMSTHYTYAHTYDNYASRYIPGPGGDGHHLTFYAIPGVDIDQFLACEDKVGLGGALASYEAVLYKANDYNIDPLNDWEIDSIEICLQKSGAQSSTSPENITTYGDYLYISSINDSSDPIPASKIVECINDVEKYIESNDENRKRLGALIISQENHFYYYCIRIHFKETDMIFWHSQIIAYDEHYYLETDYGWQYIHLTEEIEEFISSNMQSATLKPLEPVPQDKN